MNTESTTINDVTEDYQGAVIQHGPQGGRVYVMNLTGSDPEAVARGIGGFAREHGYGKCIVKAPLSMSAPFLEKGYRCEARVPGYFNGEEEVLFLALFTDPARGQEDDPAALDAVRDLALAKADSDPDTTALPDGFRLRPCTPSDAPAMSEIYREVFPVYPFPIHDPAYLCETMKSHIDYFGVESGGELVALASAEMDKSHRNVEMTDFATLPSWRGNGLALHLLAAMDEAMTRRKIKTAYTIARAVSPGMNITFARRDYRYGGRLVNNTPITGGIESMNVWHKPLG
jgi:beta-lysine N6-acetyltransferase